MVSGWYVAQRNWQADSSAPRPQGSRRKLPDLGDPNPIRNVEPTQSEELVVEDSEATGQSARVAQAGSPLQKPW